MDDPFISASQLHVYASHTKHITIQGSGFISAFDIHKKPKACQPRTEEAVHDTFSVVVQYRKCKCVITCVILLAQKQWRFLV